MSPYLWLSLDSAFDPFFVPERLPLQLTRAVSGRLVLCLLSPDGRRTIIDRVEDSYAENLG